MARSVFWYIGAVTIAVVRVLLVTAAVIALLLWLVSRFA
jgi:hypothetical protein